MYHPTVQYELEILLFSGKVEDFEYFAERFEAHLHFYKIKTVNLHQEKFPEETVTIFAGEQNKLVEKQFNVWSELVQFLEEKSLSLVRTANPNKTQAWNFLRDCLKGREPPRIHKFENKITNTRMNSYALFHDES